MQFDFERFTTLTRLAYRRCGDTTYDLDTVLAVFRYYFETYELVFQEPHPRISMEQITRIIGKMPHAKGSVCKNIPEFTLEDYEAMIDQHFATEYRDCDYNINHFFSGMIRDLRYYEVCQ